MTPNVVYRQSLSIYRRSPVSLTVELGIARNRYQSWLDSALLYTRTVITSHESSTPLRSTRLLDQLRERLRYAHYSLSTERAYVYWVRYFVRFHRLRHPRDLSGAEVASFLSWLANKHGASASTHKQALSALLFLYKHVLDVELPWMQEIGRPIAPRRLPVVLSRHEVHRLLAATTGVHQLVFRLLYGTGMRKMECLCLRVKDLDLDRKLIVVRQGKGNKDRITMLPDALQADLRKQLAYAKTL
jgi:integrase